MDFLSGLLAFAVVMILMSTIVTGVMEVLVRLLALRAGVLDAMMRRFVETELRGRLDGMIETRVGREALTAPQAASSRGAPPLALVDLLTFNPLYCEAGLSAGQGAAQASRSWVGRVIANRNRVDTLTAWAFLQRLARTEYGQAILALGEAQALDVLTDLSRTYERYASAAHEAFRKQIGAWSMAVAMLLGVAMNVNAPVLLNHLVADAAASTALIEMGPELVARGQAADASFGEALQAAAGDGAADDGDAAPAPAEGAAAADRTDDGDAAIAAARMTAADVERVLAEAERLKLPILFNAYPYVEAGEGWPEDPILRAIVWLAGALLGGVLIGLGGPFWYKVFDGLSRLTALARDLSGKSREVAVDPSDERARIVGDLDKEFGTPRMVESFRIAAGLPGAIDRDGFPPCG